MIKTTSLEPKMVSLTITDDKLDILRRMITTVDPHKAATSLFAGEVTVDYTNNNNGTHNVVMCKHIGDFVYEEIESLITKACRVTGSPYMSPCSKSLLSEAAIILGYSDKIFLPPNAPNCYINVTLDVVEIKLIDSDDRRLRQWLEVIKNKILRKDSGCDTIDVSARESSINISNYLDKIDSLVPALSSLLFSSLLKLRGTKKFNQQFLQDSIYMLIIHDIAKRELVSLDNLASCDSAHPMSPFRDAAILAQKVFRQIIGVSNMADLSEESVNILHNGFGYSGPFEDCPPFLSRSFERLYKRLPRTTAELIKERGVMP